MKGPRSIDKSDSDQGKNATDKYSYTLIGSYKVLRDIGEDPISAALMTPVYHLLRPNRD